MTEILGKMSKHPSEIPTAKSNKLAGCEHRYCALILVVGSCGGKLTMYESFGETSRLRD